MESFDYVIIGGGSAGCVLAERLSRSGGNSVLVLEAGPADTNRFIQIPAGFIKTLFDPKITWQFKSEPSAGTAGRQIHAGIAALTPIFPRGKPAYQSMSFGWILGEIVRRTDPKHRPFCAFLQEEICTPFGIEDLWVGIPDRVEPRIATMVNAQPPPAFPSDSYFVKSLPLNVQLVPEVFELPAVRRACIAGVGGIFSARSEARFWAILANGGELDGVRLLSKERVDAACVPRPNVEPDPVYFNAPMTLSQGGYWMHSATTPLTCPAKGARTICVPGAGASLGWADPDAGLAVAYCHNRMMRPLRCADHPLTAIADTIRESLGV